MWARLVVMSANIVLDRYEKVNTALVDRFRVDLHIRSFAECQLILALSYVRLLYCWLDTKRRVVKMSDEISK